MSFSGVRASPTSKFIVELSACGMSSDNVESMLPHQCHTICQMVVDAQKECEREARCTCSKVSPSALESCIQCSIDEATGDHLFESVALMPSRMKAYSDVCGHTVTQRDMSVFSANQSSSSSEETDPTSSEDKEGLSKRELNNARCLFGLPEVVEMRSHWGDLVSENSVGSWPVLGFFIVAGLCYAENRRSKVSSKSQEG